MNILFITDADISPLDGGVERVTNNLAVEFKKRNINSYLAFVSTITTPSSQEFIDKIQLKGTNWENLLLNFLNNNHIHCIIVNVMKKKNIKNILPRVYHITRNINCKVLFCYHSMPGYEIYGNQFIIRFLKWLGFSFIIKKIISLKLKYTLYSDKIILLSKEYISIYQKFVGKQANEKFGCIPNALSFNEIANENILQTKEKEILIVARLDENKRISLALKIWQKIEISNLFNDWALKIVGGGGDEKKLKHLSKKLKLKNISFEGKQNPIEYYKKASIFMMTSAYEGWGLTLTEAQQNGCVPIAFNSYASLMDIIDDQQNGVIVNNNKIDEYVEALKELMQNKEKRIFLAKNGLINCARYHSEKVMEKWVGLLGNLKSS